MPELHLRQLGFTYSACGPFTKHHERIQKFKEKGDLNYIWKRIKSCFAHDAVDANSKDLAKSTGSDKILKDRAYEIALNHKYDGYQRGLASMKYKNFDNKTGLEATSKRDKNAKEVQAQEWNKPLIKKFKIRKVCTRFKDNI